MTNMSNTYISMHGRNHLVLRLKKKPFVAAVRIGIVRSVRIRMIGIKAVPVKGGVTI